MTIQSIKQNKGFTIVELLIVIVVIGILAAITIVAYNGITARANNTAAISAVNQSVKAVQAYIAANGTYPGATGGCLTPDSGCIYAGTVYSTPSSLIANIRTVASLPGSIPNVVASDKGITYDYESTMTYNGASKPLRLLYTLRGNAINCGVANVSNSGSYTMGPSTIGYTSSSGSTTLCIVSIDGPSA